jgi:hypothetical protein
MPEGLAHMRRYSFRINWDMMVFYYATFGYSTPVIIL